MDRGPWLPAVGSETPTVYVMKLGSPKDFSFTKASTAGDPDFTWEEGSVEAGPQVGLQVPSSFLDMPFEPHNARLHSQDQVGSDTWKHDPHLGFGKEDMINITEF